MSEPTELDRVRDDLDTCRADWHYLIGRLTVLRDCWTESALPKDAQTRDYGRGVAHGLSLVVDEMVRLSRIDLPPELKP